jgi:hypothetical protein
MRRVKCIYWRASRRLNDDDDDDDDMKVPKHWDVVRRRNRYKQRTRGDITCKEPETLGPVLSIRYRNEAASSSASDVIHYVITINLLHSILSVFAQRLFFRKVGYTRYDAPWLVRQTDFIFIVGSVRVCSDYAYQPPQSSRDLLDKLTFAQLFNKSISALCNSKVIYHVHEIPLLGLILGQTKPIHVVLFIFHIYIYIYIYMCVCVCVCVC